jgi:hypothetical protein
MNAAIDVHAAEGYAVYRIVGELALQGAVDAVTQAIELCHRHQLKRLLIDGTALTQVQSPSMAERYEIVTQWALIAKGIKIAFATSPEMLDPTEFGITVAANRGLQIHGFTSEAEAVAWLLDPRTDYPA